MSLKTIWTLAIAAAAFLLLIGCGGEESTPDKQESAARSIPESPPKKATKPKTGIPSEWPEGRNKIVEKMDPDGKGMHLTATSPEGKQFNASIGDEVEIPEEFPKDVPIFPGATPMAYMSSPDEGIIVTFKSGKQQQAIFNFYQTQLADDGWEILEDSKFGRQLAFDAIKEDRRVSVVVAGTEGASRVSVIVTPEK
jgi:hypothetical protein